MVWHTKIEVSAAVFSEMRGRGEKYVVKEETFQSTYG